MADLDAHWNQLDDARACIARIGPLRIERARVVAALVAKDKVTGASVARALGTNRQRVFQLAQAADKQARGTTQMLWDRLAEVHATLVDGRGCYERQRDAMRHLVDAGVPRSEIAERAGVTVGSIAYVLGEVERKKTSA